MKTNLKFSCMIALVLLAKPAFPASFPTTFIPFASVANESAGINGDLLILGYTSPETLADVNALPLPSFVNERFTNALVQLAPSRYFSNVYIPTPAERVGDYSSFTGRLIDPLTGMPFPGNIIPVPRLFGTNSLYAFRIGPQAAAVPEPTTFGFIFLAGLAASLSGISGLIQKLKRSKNA